MSRINKRVIAGILALTTIFGVAACDSGDPSVTTQPGDSETTAPVGS